MKRPPSIPFRRTAFKTQPEDSERKLLAKLNASLDKKFPQQKRFVPSKRV